MDHFWLSQSLNRRSIWAKRFRVFLWISQASRGKHKPAAPAMRQYVGESTFVLLLEPPVLEGSDSAVLSNVSECRHYLGQHSGCGSESVSALRKACWLFPWWLPGAVLLVSCPGLLKLVAVS